VATGNSSTPPDPRLVDFVDQLIAGAAIPTPLRAEAREDFLTHLEADIARRTAAGAPPDTALAAALAAFGRIDDIRRALEQTAAPSAVQPPAATRRSRAAAQLASGALARGPGRVGRWWRSRLAAQPPVATRRSRAAAQLAFGALARGPGRVGRWWRSRSAGRSPVAARGIRVARGRRGWFGIEALLRDVRYGWRAVRGRPLAAGAAVITLAVGIGLNAAVFSMVDWVLLRPLPYPAPHELVRVFSSGITPGRLSAPGNVRYSEFLALRQTPALRSAVAIAVTTRILAGQGVEPAHVVVARVAGDLGGTIGMQPEVGRMFDDKEAGSGAPVVIVSHALWRRQFASDAAVVGRLVTIDGAPHTIIGVAPADRGYPRDADVWCPLTSAERADDDRDTVMIGRLTNGTSADRASVELGARMGATSEATRTAWAEDVQRTQVRDVRAALMALLASAAIILLMACANVAALIGARDAERTGEMAIRGALGASRARLLRQLLTESLLLATAGGLAGLLLGRWVLELLVAVAPGQVPRLGEVTLDGRVMLVGLGATLVAGLLVGLAPAFRASRLDVRAALALAGARGTTTRAGGRRLLVAAQTAMAVVLTIGAGLFGRSLAHLAAVDHGFSPDRLLAIDLYLRSSVVDGHGGDSKRRGEGDLFHTLIEGAESVPGVRGAAVTFRLPTQTVGPRAVVEVQGAPLAAGLAGGGDDIDGDAGGDAALFRDCRHPAD
jgi:putative ABC transport system permease protein